VAANSEYWHVRVKEKGRPPTGAELVVVDKSREWVDQRILERRSYGEPIVIRGRELAWTEIENVWISVSEIPASQVFAQLKVQRERSGVIHLDDKSSDWRAAQRARDVTDELIHAPVGSSSASSAPATPAPASSANPRKVMVVHGRDEKARRAMFDFLRALGLDPQEWTDLVAATGSGAPYIGQVLAKAFEIAQAVVVLFTPDDEGSLKEEFRTSDDPPEETQLTPQARPNVLFEAGMALGVHPDRTILVELGKLRPFSDIYGRHVIRLDHTEGPLREIARRLKTAGCAVDESGSDWATTSFPER
jgi:predicted nucleotide-binding protein